MLQTTYNFTLSEPNIMLLVSSVLSYVQQFNILEQVYYLLYSVRSYAL